MTTIKFFIRNAFNTCKGGMCDEIYSCFDDEIELKATDNYEAWMQAKDLQCEHDVNAWRVLCEMASDPEVSKRELQYAKESYENRPNYVKAICFDEYDENGDLISTHKVEC